MGHTNVGSLRVDDKTSSSGAAAVPVTAAIHEITTTGIGNALTLANGVEGQSLVIVYGAEGAGTDTAILTPTNLAGGTTVTFNAVGDTATLLFVGSNWYKLAGAAVLA